MNTDLDDIKNLKFEPKVYNAIYGSRFIKACTEGQFDIAQKLYLLDIDIHTNNEEAFRYACSNGNIEIAKWLYQLGANIHAKNDDTFICACSNGHINLAKWLYQLGIDLTSGFDKGICFVSACKNGHIEIAKWLRLIGAFTDLNEAFKLACANNYIDIAEWLYQLNADIHFNNDEAFRLSCLSENIEIAKWLYNIGANIHANNEEAFILACQNGSFEMVKWLYQFDINLLYLKRSPNINILKNIFNLNKFEIKLFKGILNADLESITDAINNGANYCILDDYAFYKSCKENKIEIAEYLSELDKRYFYKLDEDHHIKSYKIVTFPKNARNK